LRGRITIVDNVRQELDQRPETIVREPQSWRRAEIAFKGLLQALSNRLRSRMHGDLDVFSSVGFEGQDNPDREKDDQQCEHGGDGLFGPLDVETEFCARNRSEHPDQASQHRDPTRESYKHRPAARPIVMNTNDREAGYKEQSAIEVNEMNQTGADQGAGVTGAARPARRRGRS
jgi:hypothetical protein